MDKNKVLSPVFILDISFQYFVFLIYFTAVKHNIFHYDSVVKYNFSKSHITPFFLLHLTQNLFREKKKIVNGK